MGTSAALQQPPLSSGLNQLVIASTYRSIAKGLAARMNKDGAKALEMLAHPSGKFVNLNGFPDVSALLRAINDFCGAAAERDVAVLLMNGNILRNYLQEANKALAEFNSGKAGLDKKEKALLETAKRMLGGAAANFEKANETEFKNKHR